MAAGGHSDQRDVAAGAHRGKRAVARPARSALLGSRPCFPLESLVPKPLSRPMRGLALLASTLAVAMPALAEPTPSPLTLDLAAK